MPFQYQAWVLRIVGVLGDHIYIYIYQPCGSHQLVRIWDSLGVRDLLDSQYPYLLQTSPHLS